MYILIEGKHPLFRKSEDNEQTFIEKIKNPKWKFSD
jgi:hypothetical protein